jgi:hypothetical protein
VAEEMIELTISKDGGFVNQWCASPTVYLDHWAWIKISKDEILAKRFSRALKAQNGTLAFSWLNIIEFSKVTNAEHGRKANGLLDAIWPQVFVLYPNFLKVIEQEDKILAGGERFALHGDLETLRSILKISPLNPNSLYPLRAPKLFDLAAKTGVTFDDNADLLIDQIESWWQDYCNNPEFCSAVNRTPKGNKTEFGTRFIARELLRSFIKDRGLQTGKNRRHHAMDVSHAIVPVAYCDYVLLDGHWAIQVEQTRKRIRDGGASFHMAKVFSEKENGLEKFLQELESRTSAVGATSL